jgi:hypothetical protein
MKQLKLIIIGLLLVFSGVTKAQVGINISIGTPAWGPAERSEARFYYLPDIDVYYDRNTSYYIYLSGGNWIHAATLPYEYRNYDLYGAYKVTLNDYHGERPYDNYKEHQRDYPRGYNRGHDQKTYGERPSRGNSENRGEMHGNKEHGHDDNGNGHGNGNKEHGNNNEHGNKN